MARQIDKDIEIVINELESHGYTIGRLLHSKLMEISDRLQGGTSIKGAQDPSHPINKSAREYYKPTLSPNDIEQSATN